MVQQSLSCQNLLATFIMIENRKNSLKIGSFKRFFCVQIVLIVGVALQLSITNRFWNAIRKNHLEKPFEIE